MHATKITYTRTFCSPQPRRDRCSPCAVLRSGWRNHHVSRETRRRGRPSHGLTRSVHVRMDDGRPDKGGVPRTAYNGSPSIVSRQSKNCLHRHPPRVASSAAGNFWGFRPVPLPDRWPWTTRKKWPPLEAGATFGRPRTGRQQIPSRSTAWAERRSPCS
jgi:hypothetical protein